MRRSTSAAVRVEETFRRLATRPVLHAESEPGAGNGELGRSPLADITGFEIAMDLPPAGSATPGDAGRRRKVLAAVGALVAFAAAHWPKHDPDIDGRLRRAAYSWYEHNKFVGGASRAACKHTRHEWPGRLEPEQGLGGSRVFYRQARRGFEPPTGHAIEDAAARRRG